MIYIKQSQVYLLATIVNKIQVGKNMTYKCKSHCLPPTVENDASEEEFKNGKRKQVVEVKIL